MSLINGGFYLKARCIQYSDIAHAPPHVREIWDWLLKEANHEDTKVCKRGSCIRSYKDIQEGLHWYVGWRKMAYSKDDCETAMKWLKKRTMVTTKKTTRGMLIIVINYDKFQTVSNYDNHTSNHRKTTHEPQSRHTINKNDKNERIKEGEGTLVDNLPPKRTQIGNYGKKPHIEGDPAWQDPADPSHWRVKIHTGEWVDYQGDVKNNLTYQ